MSKPIALVTMLSVSFAAKLFSRRNSTMSLLGFRILIEEPDLIRRDKFFKSRFSHSKSGRVNVSVRVIADACVTKYAAKPTTLLS